MTRNAASAGRVAGSLPSLTSVRAAPDAWNRRSAVGTGTVFGAHWNDDACVRTTATMPTSAPVSSGTSESSGVFVSCFVPR